MAIGDKLVVVDKMFSKGFISDKGKNKTPDYFADDLWNIRIKNGGVTSRPGYEELFDGVDVNPVKGITSNNNRLYVIQNQHLREINYTLDPVTQTDRGSIATSNKCRFINYGIYTIILTGADYPWVWDGTALTQLTGSNITANANPQFGTRFAGFTVVNSQVNKNAILLSVPIGLATQTNAYDWKSTGAQSITYDSNILGMIGTLNNLWIFTETTIERMDKNSLSTTGGAASLYTIPLAKGQELLNPDCIIAAGDVIFFMTKTKKIGVINYKQTVAEPQLAIISDVDTNSIDGFMQDYLEDEDNQADAFGFYDRVNNLAKFHVRSRQSTVNDIAIIYDIQRDTYIKDDNKFYSGVTFIKDQAYTGSAFDYKVYKDEFGNNDRGDGIYRYFETTDQVYGTPWQQKQFRGASIAGQINSSAIINWNIYIDDNSVFGKQIIGSSISGTGGGEGIGESEIGGEPIGGDVNSLQGDLVDFERLIDRGSLRSSGKKIKMVFYGDELLQNFILDYMSLVIRPRKRANIQDKM